ncbi:MAG: DUF2190 family protein [Paracoccus sp. (in: a-proteobacteria)]|uniref:capsid cement protein n=1 Tax=Paracoccus sp. TaxID=267 RepID=UPI0026DED645|nr:capsid cement protein [Paracoccus sp. (in: a-proteobacteria)]MDO5614444.1 DUF2190 family protein [Paracoccus sp. (in: a-proteobacteria)]
MQYFHDILTLSVKSAGLFDAYDLIGWDDKKVTTDGAAVKGFALSPSTEIGLQVGVVVMGVVRVKASGAITKGARVISAATGGVKAAGASTAHFATALTDAADGEFVDILIR